MRFWITGSIGIMAIGVAAMANAKVVTTIVNASTYNTPYTIETGGGNSLTLSTIDKSAYSFSPEAVSTGGGLEVTSLGFPFYSSPQPSVFFANRGGDIGPTTFTGFSSFATPTTIQYSGSESILGFRFDSGSGTQYGYADFTGSNLHGYRVETTPGASVAIGSVPEPAAWALMISGFGFVGAGMRSRRAVAAAA
ncbi:PEPxxWA-CTERM sorting domain-containing protein [Polymorphobacter megasporae]|uniref:PEPxxWA-CTERM sorting domain-containing protein n=1 Tax=Glacieibacterium megasporae TaxID=2835787 RepID=UPI002107FC08|nr:PEPxxWA-CTERM sorting domain-containing protein [Polymorphobacter megasporae]